MSEAWHEVVGVVADVPSNTNTRTMYHPMAPGQALPVSLMLRVGDAQSDVAGRIREITTMLDPTLRVDEILSLDEVYRRIQLSNNVAGLALAVVMVSVLLLSAAGLYALMSFTVNQRRREIWIRSALGAQPRRLLAGIFRRALGQVGAGAVGGVLAALLIGYYLPLEEMGGWNVPGIIPGAAVIMVVIGLLAAFGPARRTATTRSRNRGRKGLRTQLSILGRAVNTQSRLRSHNSTRSSTRHDQEENRSRTVP